MEQYQIQHSKSVTNTLYFTKINQIYEHCQMTIKQFFFGSKTEYIFLLLRSRYAYHVDGDDGTIFGDILLIVSNKINCQQIYEEQRPIYVTGHSSNNSNIVKWF